MMQGHMQLKRERDCYVQQDSTHMQQDSAHMQHHHSPSRHAHCNALQHGATHCNTLQHAASHCNTGHPSQHHALQHRGHLSLGWYMQQHVHDNKCDKRTCNIVGQMRIPQGHDYDMHDTSPGGSGAVNEQHCNTLQHSATHCDMHDHRAAVALLISSTATHCNALQYSTPRCNNLHGGADREQPLMGGGGGAANCDTLQHSATHYNMQLGGGGAVREYLLMGGGDSHHPDGCASAEGCSHMETLSPTHDVT